MDSEAVFCILVTMEGSSTLYPAPNTVMLVEAVDGTLVRVIELVVAAGNDTTRVSEDRSLMTAVTAIPRVPTPETILQTSEVLEPQRELCIAVLPNRERPVLCETGLAGVPRTVTLAQPVWAELSEITLDTVGVL